MSTPADVTCRPFPSLPFSPPPFLPCGRWLTVCLACLACCRASSPAHAVMQPGYEETLQEAMVLTDKIKGMARADQEILLQHVMTKLTEEEVGE
jgi:hypothetical protein